MAIILATVITTNIVNNRTLVNANYSTTTDNANSNMVADYIKKGITIGGITGTLESLNTFDATATAEDIIWGKTGYVKGEKITGTKIVTIAHARDAQKTFETNTVLTDDYGNNVKVPAGFKIAEDSPTVVTDGIVIEDVDAGNEYTKGSQFVWVPVGDVITNKNESTIHIILGRHTFASNGNKTLIQSAENWSDTSSKVAINTYYKELANSNKGNKAAKNLEGFVTKALTSGGYYIGRYEAGDATATKSERTSSSSDTNPLVSKSGVYPYNYITQPQASSLCQGMYSSSNFESDLINSYAWDTAIVFIQEFSGDTNYSEQRGRNTARAVQKCGESILDYNLDAGDEAQDIRCNIYDMAGNTREWSTETYSYTIGPCVIRGGSCNNTISSSSIRSYTGTARSLDIYSARPTLYL